MISIEQISKEFIIPRHPLGLIKYLLRFAKEGKDYTRSLSLKDISLSIPSGEVHGVIGMNGAGKSTLLKILTGVLQASTGRVQIEGKVAALLELGTGFHRELTGRENIYITGPILGFSKEEIEAKLPEIMEFSELGEYFDRPIKTYSSGMYVRLAFSLAISVSPDVLIIDEALSVGDAYFQNKCLKKIKEFKDKNITILLVSHDLSVVKLLCDRVTVLSHGEHLFTGSPLQAVDLYNALISEFQNRALVAERAQQAAKASDTSPFESGNKRAEVCEVSLLNKEGKALSAITAGDEVSILIKTKVHADQLLNPTCGILIKDRLGLDVFGTNTFHLGKTTGLLKQGDLVSYQFSFPLNLGPGFYTLSVSLHEGRTHLEENFHWIERSKVFQVLPSSDFSFIGVSKLLPHCEISRAAS